ncbi:hypothetical protein ACI2OX_04285 [Bacillus sp. N9]
MNDPIQLLRQEPGFVRLFTLFKEKYRSLGRIGERLVLKIFQMKNYRQLRGSLGRRKKTEFLYRSLRKNCKRPSLLHTHSYN